MSHSENLRRIANYLRRENWTMQGDECDAAADELDRLIRELTEATAVLSQVKRTFADYAQKVRKA